MLVTLMSTKHLHSITKHFRERFREHCLGHKLDLSPRKGPREPKLYHHLLLEALTSTSTQIWWNKFPKRFNLSDHTRIP